MLINADFTQRAAVATHDYNWVASPQPGVERVMLDRVGGERARATSIVRYSAGSSFAPHQHLGGEEILVLSGTFADDDDSYPAGRYLRNPPGSSHAPSSPDGAVIFVKLWQMPTDEQRKVRIDTRRPEAWQQAGDREVCQLHVCESESVCLVRLSAGTLTFDSAVEHAEVLVLSGSLVEAGRHYEAGSWLRFPPGEYPQLRASIEGCTFYFRDGYLIGLSSKV
ncbi:anti-sigma factor [Pseudomonas nabeulensis]|uniref:Anti-sigma factor n=1 Tax=Pseudomonas nabeulensis TaxID=2293833 RepID=A0A4Z0B8D7_9PSED|nr:cupin domain-containing protein [Pseudomonas nabeulensis]TFY95322.1 anti-sigma factor [Pseudomonas nabeulensis]